MRASSVDAVSATIRTSGARARTRCVVSIPSMPPGSSRSWRTTCGRHSSSRSSSSSPVVAIPTSFRSGKDSRYACRLRPTTRWSSTMAIEIGMSRECVEKLHVEPDGGTHQRANDDEYHADADRNREHVEELERQIVRRCALIVDAAGPIQQESGHAAERRPREGAAGTPEQRGRLDRNDALHARAAANRAGDDALAAELLRPRLHVPPTHSGAFFVHSEAGAVVGDRELETARAHTEVHQHPGGARVSPGVVERLLGEAIERV